MNRNEIINSISKLEKLNQQAKRLIEGHGGTMLEEQEKSTKEYIKNNETKIEKLESIKEFM